MTSHFSLFHHLTDTTPIYAGWLTVKSWGLEPKRGNFEPLVTDEVFMTVEDILQGRKRSVAPHVRNHPDFPLRRFVKCAKCGTPLTAAWSKGRQARPYAYYRCRTSGCVHVTKAELENQFVDYLDGFRPTPELMRLFREIVLDAWKRRQGDTEDTTKALERRLADSRTRKDQLVDAFVYRHAIDEATYQDQVDKLAEEIAMAEMELHDARLEKLDVEGVVAFAEQVMPNTPRLWMECSIEQKQRLQKVLFPAGVRYSGESFGTTEISTIFRLLHLLPTQNAREGSRRSKDAFGTAETAVISRQLPHSATTEMKRSVPDGI